MNTINKTIAVVFALTLMGTAAQADEFDLAVAEVDSWQQNRLFAPSAAARAQEEAGSVVIYEGLRDVDVENAMDAQFERIENMMFVNTVVTDEEGNPRVDPRTGRAETESDDC